jgi:hypothetical protein
MKTVQGQQLVESIHRLVRAARRGLVLVSPYFDPWEEIADYIETALGRGTRVMIVIREGQQNAEEAAEDFEDRGAIIRSVPDLHAKLYLSEMEAISTSMNLLTSSANTAVEIGHVFDAVSDEQHYRQLIAQSERLAPNLRWGDLVAGRAQPRSRCARRAHRGRKRVLRAQEGHCIRCGSEIGFDLEQPFCTPHMRSWARFENVDYPEEFCHSCGEPAETSMAKPRCYGCWQTSPRA